MAFDLRPDLAAFTAPGVEAEVGAPRGVDDERDAVSVGHLRERADVADGAHVRRLADEDTLGVRGGREGLLERGGRHPERQAVGRVDLWAHPDRLQAGKHEADLYVDQFPYTGEYHLNLKINDHVSTSVLLVARRGG